MQIVVCKHVWEGIHIGTVEVNWLIGFWNQIFKILLVLRKQECFLKKFSFFKILKVFCCSRITKLFFHSINLVLKINAPDINELMNEQIVWVKFLNLIKVFLGLSVKIVVTYFYCKTIRNHGIAHFPKCNWTTMVEWLYSIFVILEKHLGSLTIIRQCLKNDLLNFLIDNVLLIPSVEKRAIFHDGWV